MLTIKNKFSKIASFGAVLLFFILTLFVSMQGFAQDDDDRVRFGIKGGVSLSNLYSGNTVTDEKVKPGFLAGVYLKAPIVEDLLFIQPELIYIQKGNQSNYSNFIQGSGKYQFSLGYVELPVAIGVKLGPVSIHAGPYAAYLTNAKVKDVNSDGTIKGATDLNQQNFNTIDYGVFGGAGFDLKYVQVGARYDLGLREIGNSGLAGQLTQNAKNSALQIYLGINF